MDKLIKVAAFSFIWNVIIGIIFVVFNQEIFERTDIALLMRIGSLIISSMGFLGGYISLCLYRLIKIKRAKKMDQNS